MPLMVIMMEKMWRVEPLIHIMKHSMATWQSRQKKLVNSRIDQT